MILLLSHFAIIALCLVMKIFGVSERVVGLLFVILSTLATIVYVFGAKDISKELKLIILLGFALRIILVVVDVYIMRLPDAATDDDAFYNTSLKIYDNDYTDALAIASGGVFPKLLALVYYLIGSSRFSIQYVNVLLYVIAAIVFLRAMMNFGVEKKYLKISTVIFCLMPNTMLFNSILRRETIMELCVCSSLFFFSKWHNDNKLSYALLSVLFIALASLFHTAMIFVALIFIVYYALYNKKKGTISYSLNNLSKMAILFVCAVVAGMGFLSMWNNKFTSVSDIDDVYTAASRARGGSVYLEGYQINNLWQLIMFSPLKLFYFLFSPVPWKFRNAMDVVSFVLDALVYTYLILRVIRSPKSSSSKLLFATFIIASAIFALGTFNSGTAIRHRFSLLPFLLASYSITKTIKANKEKVIELENDDTNHLNKDWRRV